MLLFSIVWYYSTLPLYAPLLTPCILFAFWLITLWKNQLSHNNFNPLNLDKLWFSWLNLNWSLWNQWCWILSRSLRSSRISFWDCFGTSHIFNNQSETDSSHSHLTDLNGLNPPIQTVQFSNSKYIYSLYSVYILSKLYHIHTVHVFNHQISKLLCQWSKFKPPISRIF